MDRPVPERSLQDRREHTIAVLCRHFASDNLDIEDFEGRLDAVHRASTQQELESLVQDLPALRGATEAEVPRRAAAAIDSIARHGQSLGQAVRDSRTLVAFMSGVERRGHWTPARKNICFAIMGGIGLDFRDVQLPPGETEVSLFCLMGGAEIIVPPDLAVDSSGIAIMGGFESVSPPRSADPDAPVLRIQGTCIMGGVEIVVRRNGETARDARAREKSERKALRERRRLSGEE
jgi:hypothetical protein